MRNMPIVSNQGAGFFGSLHWQNLSRICVCIFLTSAFPDLSAAQSLAGRRAHAPRPPCRSHVHYAGQCDVHDPCAHYDSDATRYGDDRDFECFIVDEN
jgi:hypothetical protein